MWSFTFGDQILSKSREENKGYHGRVNAQDL